MEPTVIRFGVDLSAPRFREIAAHYERLARACRARVAELDQWAANQANARCAVATAHNGHQILARYLCQGHPYEQALQAAVAATGIPAETIEYHWRRQNRADLAREAQERALNAVRLAAEGHSNRAIAEKLGIHPKSVTRITSKNLRKTTHSSGPP
jgi:DNA-binding NarL/FixJ family response regulator